MATSRVAVLGLASVALIVAGCGAGATTTAVPPVSSQATVGSRPPDGPVGGFAWLRPGAAPAGWRTAAIATGAAIPYPPGWHPVRGDAGTLSVALRGADGRFLGYLNLTPRQGAETPQNWSHFRVSHNADEGDREVRALASAQDLRFRGGRGPCVRDAYTTSTGSRFIEIACLVVGPRSATVVVGAAPPAVWSRISPLLERAISGFTA